ncbi:PREDICTED: uncharacterized protein LOC105313683 [Amphimedon queenslandica]|uniref:DUF3419 family protein n=1 Tax=Amphimedon queenslandica TaxID=400682 RepID=A0AAN0INE9_AMPQE|nr:PREDICTED: uncharacterized protein LOC105313683 [Amphimedon queenslandica]|eukprot:XP_011405611.1 PREDICTED: uncharacterized protein LOC105313683 [Amphimedon queenslandica]
MESSQREGEQLKSEITVKPDFTVIRYSRVWEDCVILCKGLDIQPSDVVLSITSSGDNVLNVLLKKPKKIYAVDMSLAQNALLELKLGAIRISLSHDKFLQLLGEAPSTKRLVLYESVKPSLPKYAQEFWDSNLSVIESGIANEGTLEKYLKVFNEKHLPKVVSSELLDAFFESQSIEEQRKVFNQFPLKELKDLISLYFSKEKLEKRRSEAQFQHAKIESDEAGEAFAKRYFVVAENIPAHDNFYFSLFNRGMKGYDPANKPNFAAPYLAKDNYEELKGLIDRVVVCTSTIEEQVKQIPLGTVTKANLSDIFEYTNEEVSCSICESVANVMAPGGRIVYWELQNTRPAPSSVFHYHEKLSKELHAEDRVFYYKSFNVYEKK